MLSAHLCCCCPQSPPITPSDVKEFFESINPKSDFNNDGDALETYLYEKSLKVQPKDAEKIPDVKPKRSLHVLKSPGIKPPKTNHYSSSHHHAATSYSTQSSTAPSTPRPDGEGPRPPLLTPPDAEDAHFSLVDITPGQHPKFVGDVPRRAHKIGQLQPPPLVPRRAQKSTTAAPSPAISSPAPSTAPPLHPRRTMPVNSSPSSKSPQTPVRMSGDHAPQAFVFPSVESQYSPPPPALPPRLSTTSSASTTPGAMSSNEQLRVVLDSESNSPTVCLSVPLPPALPPRRGTAAQQTPPPLPPKMRTTGSPSLQRASVSPSSPDTPPPLPPKTYKLRKQNDSPPTATSPAQ